MKWIKHKTETWNDERIANLVGDGGQSGLARYGAYWRVQEILAAQMDGPDPSCSVQYNVTRWSVLMSLRGSHVRHYLSHLAKKGLVTVEWIGSEIRVTNLKLLKYRDEYSRKSGHASNNVPPRQDTETEQIQSIASETEKPEVFVDAWNENCGTLPRVSELSDGRRQKIQTRVSKGLTAARFSEAVRRCANTPFLAGGSDGNWRATFDWLIKNDSNLLKVMEGQYASAPLKEKTAARTDPLAGMTFANGRPQ